MSLGNQSTMCPQHTIGTSDSILPATICQLEMLQKPQPKRLYCIYQWCELVFVLFGSLNGQTIPGYMCEQMCLNS